MKVGEWMDLTFDGWAGTELSDAQTQCSYGTTESRRSFPIAFSFLLPDAPAPPER